MRAIEDAHVRVDYTKPSARQFTRKQINVLFLGPMITPISSVFYTAFKLFFPADEK